MKCEICNKDFSTSQAFKNHIRWHKISSKEYYDKYIDSSFHKCNNCDNEAKFISLFKGYSNRCQNCISSSVKQTKSICKICGITFTNPCHVKSHNLTAQKYYDLYYKKENEGICLTCGKPTKFIGLLSGYESYCCPSCNPKLAIQKNYICKICNKEVNGHAINNHMKKLHNLTTKEYYDKYLRQPNEGICIVCGKETIFDRMAYSKYCSIEHESKDTNIDIKICKICNDKFLDYNILSAHIKRIHKLSPKQYYDTYLKKEGEGLCLVCGKPTNFRDIYEGYSLHCSCTCAQLNKDTREKSKQTCLKKYGVDTPMHSEQIKNKMKANNLEKYDVEYTFQAPEIRQRIIETNIKKFGFENPMQNPEIKAKSMQTNKERYGGSGYQSPKTKETMLNRYGVENGFKIPGVHEKAIEVAHLPEVDEKRRNTNIEKYGTPVANQFGSEMFNISMINKYGVDNVWRIPGMKDLIIQHNLEKYGYEHTLQRPEIQEKIKNTNKEKYGVEYVAQNKNIQTKIQQTNIEKFGVSTPLKLQEVHQKGVDAKEKYNKLDKELGDPDE